MQNPKHSLFRIYGFAVIASFLLLGVAGVSKGWAALVTVIILSVLEVTFSFDNAVVNAKVLQRMSRGWQTAFMTIGIAIAVFGVRIFLPVAIVALATKESLLAVWQTALHDPATYAAHLAESHASIAAFGGMFLLMVFLGFILTDREIRWLRPVEDNLAKLGQIDNVNVAIALVVLAVTLVIFTPSNERVTVLVAGLLGLITYLLIHLLDRLFMQHEDSVTTINKSFKAGLVGFIYLEFIDASFSLDGVLGAFVITKDVVLIAIGLGIGALFVRSMTVHLLRRNTLKQYLYLEHGAHYAIGILACLMLVSIRFHVPEVITGLAGLAIIATAIQHSRLQRKKPHAKAG